MSESEEAFGSCCEAALQVQVNAAARHVETIGSGSPFTSRGIREGFTALRDLKPFNAAWIERINTCRSAFNDAITDKASSVLIGKAVALNMAAAGLESPTQAAQKAKDDLIVPRVAGLSGALAENFGPIKDAFDGVIDAELSDLPSKLGSLFGALKDLKGDLDQAG
jgi:hypothetical protein